MGQVRWRRSCGDSLGRVALDPEWGNGSELRLPGKERTDLRLIGRVPGLLDELLRSGVVRIELEDADHIGIIVVVAVEVGFVRDVHADPRPQMLFPDLANLFALTGLRLVLYEK